MSRQSLGNWLDAGVVRLSRRCGRDPCVALVRWHYWWSWGEMRPVWRELLRRSPSR